MWKYNTADTLGIIGIIIGVIGAIVAIYYGRKAISLDRKLNRFNWMDIENGVKALSRKVKKDFKPDLIFSLSGSPSIVSNLFIKQSEFYVPILTGISIYNNDSLQTPKILNYRIIESKKWHTYIPEELKNHKHKKILIIDDIVLSGDTLEKIKTMLLEFGFKSENIRSASLFCTDIAIESAKCPDHFWYKTNNHNFFLPWGISVGSKGVYK
jgi:hypoxanthine phosphoribosyltransferase